MKLPGHINAAIFDLDNTLIISAHVWEDIDRKFLAKRGLEVPEDYCRDIACMNFREGADYTIARFGLKEDRLCPCGRGGRLQAHQGTGPRCNNNRRRGVPEDDGVKEENNGKDTGNCEET